MRTREHGQAALASPRIMSSGDAWLPLGAAGRLVGAGPETLRRWADHGSQGVVK
jgi:hypothetical protein